MTTEALRVEEAENLRRQIGELDDVEDSDILFADLSKRHWETLYNTETGEPIKVLRYHLREYLQKRRADGSAMFTARQELVPEYKLGTYHCFISKGAPEEEVARMLGIFKNCPAVHLQNETAAEIHAEKAHKSEWRMYQRYLATQDQARRDEQNRQQMEAMLKLAGSVVTPERIQTVPAHIETYTCDICGTESKSAAGLAAHKRSHPEDPNGNS